MMRKNEYKTLGARVKFARENAGIESTAALAEAVKKLAPEDLTISQQAIDKIERNITKKPWAIPYIAEITNFSAYWIASGKQPNTESDITNDFDDAWLTGLDEKSLLLLAERIIQTIRNK